MSSKEYINGMDSQPTTASITSKGGGTFSNQSKSSATTSNGGFTELPLPNPNAPHWKQKQFFLSTFRSGENNWSFSIYERAYRNLKEAGINLLENAFLGGSNMHRALQSAETVGIQCLAQDGNTFSGIFEKYPPNDDSMMLDIVRELNQYKTLEGYYVWDEPEEQNLEKFKSVCSFFKRTDPARLVFMAFLPSYSKYNWSSNHANWENDPYMRYIENFLEADLDVVSFDYYPFFNSIVSINESYLWRDMGYLRKRALELNKPFWYYFQAVPLNTGLANLPIVNMKVQMYSALAYGVSALSYFHALNDVIVDNVGNKASRFNDIKAMNQEVVNLGNFLFGKTSSKLYHTGVSADKIVGYFIDSLAADDLIQSLPNGVIAGVFTDCSTMKYLVIANKNFTGTLTGTLALKSAKKVSSYNKTTNTNFLVSARIQNVPLNIPAGDCSVFVIE